MRDTALVEQGIGSGLWYRPERTTLLQSIEAEVVVRDSPFVADVRIVAEA